MDYHLNNYPFSQIETHIKFPLHERLAQEDIGFDEEANVPLLSPALAAKVWNEDLSKEENLFNLIKFLGKKVVEHSQALQLAEDQLQAIIKKNPFIPEYFGFKEKKLLHKHPSLTGYEVFINGIQVCIYRISASDLWIVEHGVQTVIFSNEKSRIIVEIPNALVGFMVMASLGIVPFNAEQVVDLSPHNPLAPLD